MSLPNDDVSTEGADHLLVEDRPVAGGVVRILTLHRPACRNALNTALLQDLTLALESADHEQAVRAVVLAGRGAVFCAGGDIKEFVGRDDAAERMLVRARLLTGLLSQLPTMSTPVVAALTGAALGAGAALALACDLIVGGDDLVLGYPEIADSVVPAVVMAGLVRLVGQKLAFEMLTQGRRLDADESRGLDLVSAVVSPERTVEVAVERAAVWARVVDPQAVSETKRLFYRVSEMTLDDGFTAGLEVTAATWRPRH